MIALQGHDGDQIGTMAVPKNPNLPPIIKLSIIPDILDVSRALIRNVIMHIESVAVHAVDARAQRTAILRSVT